VGHLAPRRQPKGVHKEGMQLQWPQFSKQALAGAKKLNIYKYQGLQRLVARAEVRRLVAASAQDPGIY